MRSAGGSSSSSPLFVRVLSVPVLKQLLTDVREFFVNWAAVVVETGGLEDDAGGADDDRHRENPQEQSVEDHCHVFPVLFCLCGVLLGSCVLCYEVHANTGSMHCDRTATVVKGWGVSTTGQPWGRVDLNR